MTRLEYFDIRLTANNYIIATQHCFAIFHYYTLIILQARLEMGAKGDNWAARRDGRILKRM